MTALYVLPDRFRLAVRTAMRLVAVWLNAVSRGRLHPHVLTVTSLLAHLPIAWVVATSRSGLLAALLLMTFGLFDALDGELARLQNRASRFGMLLDSVTDRMKEIVLYIGIVHFFAFNGYPSAAVWAAAACGASLLVSYINAWGEAVTAGTTPESHALNKNFRSGLMSFDVRMTMLVIGLAVDRLLPAVVLIAGLSFLTALTRMANISRRLA